MPQFLPFRGILYDTETTGLDISAVAAPPYDVIDEDRRTHLERSDPHNVVQLTLPRDGDPDDRYERAGATLRRWLDEGVVRVDPEPCLYLYRVEFDDESGHRREMRGVIGALEVLDPDGGGVLPHERTMPKPKSDRLDLLRATRANLEPIWGLTLTPGLSDLLADAGDPAAWCTDTRGARHSLHRIADPERIEAIGSLVASSPLVIADGHHRYETSLRYRHEHAGTSGPHDFIMSLVVELTDEQLVVQPIHRLVTGAPAGAVRELAARAFDVVDLGDATAETIERLAGEMASRGAMGLVDAAGAALLVPRPEVLEPLVAGEPPQLRDIDATRFETALAPALADAGAEVSYRHGRREVAELVAKGDADAAVLLRPVDVPTIRRAAQAGLRMPQKTTFFHPKPSTGLVIRSLDA